ncbi:helix-turn-helix domain-containing protein [Rubritalea spongiae]|uniref:Helix-turn-helix domain-containing protein n=1 Tax=Rubritalea spongiae TaxID=430797 RepID=A0ABW5DZ26_9BACT
MDLPNKNIEFIPSRLTEVRAGLGFSMAELARKVKVTPQAISNYEAGVRVPDPEVLIKIASELGFPMSYFTGAHFTKITQRGTTFFRSQLSARTKKEQAIRSQETSWIFQVYSWLSSYVTFPELDLPNDQLSRKCTCSRIEECTCNQKGLTLDEIETLAANLRIHWGLSNGPISNMVDLLESKGIAVVRQKSSNAKLDAVSQYVNGVPIVFLGDDKISSVRSRFDAAHELGHILMHSSVSQRELAEPAVLKRVEKEANAFASAFLMPRRTFGGEVYKATLKSFESLKPRWLVSMQAMIVRANTLGLISAADQKRLFIQISSKGYRKSEPLDDKIPFEQPRLLNNAWRLITDKGGMRSSRIVEDLRLPIDLIAGVLNVRAEELVQPSKIVGLNLKLAER